MQKSVFLTSRLTTFIAVFCDKKVCIYEFIMHLKVNWDIIALPQCYLPLVNIQEILLCF